MKIGILTAALGVSESTIRNWIKEFEPLFSDGANMTNTRQRIFTDEDVAVLATVKRLRSDGVEPDEIRQRLMDGERVENPGQAQFAIDRRVVPAAAVEQIIDATELRVALEKIIVERDKLLEIMESERHEHNRINDALRDEIRVLQGEIKELQRSLGRAEGELDYRRSLDSKE